MIFANSGFNFLPSIGRWQSVPHHGRGGIWYNQGQIKSYAYDNFNRLSYSVPDGITTLYTYDGARQQTAVTVKGRDNGEITTGSEYTSGTSIETQTNPDGGTQVTTYYLGQTTGVSETAVHPQSNEYGANWQMATTPVASGVNMTVKNDTDLLGRNFQTEYADSSYSMNTYNVKNQLVKSVTPGGMTTLYAYDTLGR